MGRSRERLAIAKKALHSDVPEVSTFEGDVRDAASVDAVVRGVNDGLGSIDVVVHAAGVSAAIGCTWEVDPLVWRDDLDTSVLGAFVLAQRVVPQMLDRSVGRLIALSSYAAVRPAPHQSGYAAGKAAVVSFVESLDAELSGTGVHAFSVTPGFVQTEMTEAMAATPWFAALAERRDDIPPERVAGLINRIARGDADALSGRFLHALDDLDELVARVVEIEQGELYAPRLRRLQPRSGM